MEKSGSYLDTEGKSMTLAQILLPEIIFFLQEKVKRYGVNGTTDRPSRLYVTV